MKSDESDLSEYEKLRLINIQRNNSFLASLGLKSRPDIAKSANREGSAAAVIKTEQQNEKKRSRADAKSSIPAQPTRYSKRIRNEQDAVAVEVKREDNDPELDEGIDYTEMPTESTDLDDHEFQAFVILRRWRLLKSRELEFEPYKIFQNRTLAEVIRRRRQDPNWAMAAMPGIVSSSLDGNRDQRHLPAHVDEPADISKVSRDLLQCWGIGPSKCKPGSFTYEMLDVLCGNECNALLIQSRSIVSQSQDTIDAIEGASVTITSKDDV